MAQQALLISCSYHAPKTQRLMRAYRIGTVKLPWVNFVPPLHGGIYRKSADDGLDASSPEDDLSDRSSDTAVYCSSSSTSLAANSSEQLSRSQSIESPPLVELPSRPVPRAMSTANLSCPVRPGHTCPRPPTLQCWNKRKSTKPPKPTLLSTWKPSKASLASIEPSTSESKSKATTTAAIQNTQRTQSAGPFSSACLSSSSAPNGI